MNSKHWSFFRSSAFADIILDQLEERLRPVYPAPHSFRREVSQSICDTRVRTVPFKSNNANPELVHRFEFDSSKIYHGVFYECFTPFEQVDKAVRLFLMRYISRTCMFRIENDGRMSMGDFFFRAPRLRSSIQSILDIQHESWVSHEYMASVIATRIERAGGLNALHEVYLDHLDEIQYQFNFHHPFFEVDLCRLCKL